MTSSRLLQQQSTSNSCPSEIPVKLKTNCDQSMSHKMSNRQLVTSRQYVQPNARLFSHKSIQEMNRKCKTTSVITHVWHKAFNQLIPVDNDVLCHICNKSAAKQHQATQSSNTTKRTHYNCTQQLKSHINTTLITL